MAFWLVLGLWAATTVLGWLTRPKIKDPGPASLGDFQFPTIDSTRPIPKFWGTILQKAPNLVWYGALRTEKITKPSGFLGLGSTTVGYRYFLGMHFVLGHGLVDEVITVRFDEKAAQLTQGALGDHQRITIDDPNLFGGDGGTVILNAGISVGGVGGDIDFYWGTPSQSQNDYLQAKITSDIPAFRRVCHAVLRDFYVGTSPVLKNIAFEVRCTPNPLGLGSGHHLIASHDANPANILYEILTDSTWGCGDEIKPGDIDLASFQAAGDTLFAEGLGMTLSIESVQDARDAIAEIKRYIDGVLYEDPVTGLITLALVRNDYDPLTLPVYTDADFDSMTFSRGSWKELANVALVTYTERPAYQKRIAQHQNLSAIQSMGGARKPESYDFSAVTAPLAANKLAAREIKPRSYPLAKMTLVAKRKAYALRPGSVFKWNSARYNFTGMAVRVLGPKEAELTNGRITLECVEDVFGITDTAFGPPGPTQWTDPVTDPVAPIDQVLLEAPYHLIGTEDRYVLAAAVRSAGSDLGYQIWSDRTGGTAYAETNESSGFTASGLLTANYLKNTAATDAPGFTVSSPVDLESLNTIGADEFAQGRNLCLIGSEILAFKTVVDNGDGTFTIQNVMRGVLDTVPADHSSGARVWFIAPSGAAVVDPFSSYGADGNVRVKLLPFNARKVFALASATSMLITTASRAQKPYPPGNVKIAGVAWPTSVTGGVDIAVTWNHRHRIVQYENHVVVAQDAGSYTTSAEGPYTIEVRVGGVLKRTDTALLSATTWTWTAAWQAADGATVGSTVSIRVIPTAGLFVGTYQERVFTIA